MSNAKSQNFYSDSYLAYLKKLEAENAARNTWIRNNLDRDMNRRTDADNSGYAAAFARGEI